MFDSIRVLQHRCATGEILAGRNCAKRRVFPLFQGFERSQSQLLKTGVAQDRLPNIATKFAPRLRARAIWKSKSLKTGPGHFWKISSAKFAPRCGARAIWKSKSLKTDGLRTFLEVENAFRVAGANVAKYVAGAGAREGCKNVGRSSGFEEGPKRCFSHGRRRDSCSVMSMFEASDPESS